jgi:DNA-binding PucR family transcriptional regulator
MKPYRLSGLASVVNRLRRIQQITEIDLDDAETRFLVQLALRAYDRLPTESGA